MTGIAEALATMKAEKPSFPCSVCDMIDGLDKSDREAVESVLSNSHKYGYAGPSIEMLSTLLRASGHSAGVTTLRKHKRVCLQIDSRRNR